MKIALDLPSGNNGPDGKPIKLEAPPGLNEGALSGTEKDAVFQISQLSYNIFFTGILIIAVIVIMLSGIQIITSRGDAEKIKAGKSRILYAVVGLLILLGAFFILTTLTGVVNVTPQYIEVN